MDRFIAKKDIVISFLEDLKKVLNSPNFNIEKDFILGGKHERQKNTATLLEFEMDREDVVEELKKLTILNYYHTVPDNKRSEMPDFHVFFITVLDREIYVKVRIQNINDVFCISFHFAEYSHGKMPY
ncbi:MAG: hypothetical protein J6B87_03310 [Clostridia bacterium]|nr:hypothetical protein [Clostridia bacterium]